MSPKTRGKFIVLDGNVGAGKSTMMQAAREFYGDKLFLTREIGGSPLAEAIRHQMLYTKEGEEADAVTHFNLAWAARADHLKNKIKPRLDGGLNVMSDRFDSTTWAYQIYAENGHDLEELFWLERKVVMGEYVPDLYILLDVLPETGMKRKGSQGDRDGDHFDRQNLEFFEKARLGFADFFKKVPNRIINANQPLEKVKTEFLKILNDIIGK